MDSVRRFIPICGRAALLATACLLAPLHAGDTLGLADRELAKRYQGVEEAQELLQKGDEAYRNGRYAEAVEAFGGARELIPSAPATAELRAAATERFATASVQRGRELARKGDVEGARRLVDKVLADGVAPDHVDARCFRDQLDDPIRTNPALTAEHAKNVDEVRRALYTAEGAFNLGDFDKAKSHYEKVLRIDPTNTAARRGLERVASAKSDYLKSANDHTRAEMLSQVDGAWELAVPPAAPVVPALDGGAVAEASGIPLAAKLDRIIIPQIDLEQVSLEDAVDFLRSQSAQHDTLESDPKRKGVNITVNFRGGGEAEMDKQVQAARFNLRLRNVPVSQVLRYITELTRTSYTTDDFAVILRPAAAGSSEMITRTFRVPPDFLTTASSHAAAAPAADPFAEKPAGEGLLSRRRGALEIFKEQGVSFPEGSYANHNPATNTLMVRNTEANIDMIAQIVEVAAKTEPVQVVVRVTILNTEERNLKELGFDWLLNDFGLGGSGYAPGTDALTLSGGTQGNGGDLSDIPLATGSSNRNPVTAGNRSGDEAIDNDSIDELIATQSSGGATRSRAPGALWLNGVMNDSDFQMVMRGLDQKKGVDLMANPSVVTRSGQAASVQIVREFIYPTEYEPPELPNSVGGGGTFNLTTGTVSGQSTGFPVTPATPTAFEKRDVGIVLEVLPTVSEDKRYVEIDLNPSITDFDGFVNYGSPINTSSTNAQGTPTSVQVTQNAILMPVFSTRRTKTSLTIADGATVVIGGLIEEKIQNVEDKTPILGDLPVVGRLFQSKARSPVKKAVVFMVNVQLQDPSGHPINAR